MKLYFFGVILILFSSKIFADDKEKIIFSTYTHQSLQFELKYPEKLLFSDTESGKNGGNTFYSKDKQVFMKVWPKTNESEITWEKEFQDVLGSPINTQVTYKVFKDKFFVVSGYRGEKIFYLKEIRVPGINQESFLTFEMLFPKKDKEFWNPILITCVNSLKPIQINPEGSTVSKDDSVTPDYEINYSFKDERNRTFHGFKVVNSLAVSLLDPVTIATLSLGADSETVTFNSPTCLGYKALLNSHNDTQTWEVGEGDRQRDLFKSNGTYQTAIFSPKKKFTLIMNCETEEAEYMIGPEPPTTTCGLSLYSDAGIKWTIKGNSVLTGDESVDVEDVQINDETGQVYLKTNSGFFVVSCLGKIAIEKSGDSHISRNRREVAYEENSFIHFYDLWHWSNFDIPPKDCSAVHAISNFGDALLCSIIRTGNKDGKTIYELIDRGGNAGWHINTTMKPIDFVYLDEGYDGGFFVFFDEKLKKFVYFRTQYGNPVLTVSLPSLGKGFEEYYESSISLSYDGSLLAMVAQPRIRGLKSKVFVFNIKGEILWSSDFPAGRCFFTTDNKLILSGETEADYILTENY